MNPKENQESDTVGMYNLGASGEQVFAIPESKHQEAVAIEASQGDAVKFTDEELQAAVMGVVEQHCCWGKKPAREMFLSGVTDSNAYHCYLETFMEKRVTSTATRPHLGEQPDGPFNGYPPNPWEIVVTQPPLFTEKVINVVVPHTEQVRPCSKCFGTCNIRCDDCNGRGKKTCHYCSGKGQTSYYDGENGTQWRTCYNCNGTGSQRCSSCSGMGTVTCDLCDGKGRLVHYVNLKVSFIDYKEHKVLDQSGLPAELIQDSTGLVLVEQAGYRLLPPVGLRPDIGHACSSLIKSADERIAEGTQRLLQQRVTIRCIPVCRAHATAGSKEFDFWVYGTDKTCYLPAYPSQCCWGCSTM